MNLRKYSLCNKLNKVIWSGVHKETTLDGLPLFILSIKMLAFKIFKY